MAAERKKGDCLHESAGICTCGRYQNYVCPYTDKNKCPRFFALTDEHINQWQTLGYICIKNYTGK